MDILPKSLVFQSWRQLSKSFTRKTSYSPKIWSDHSLEVHGRNLPWHVFFLKFLFWLIFVSKLLRTSVMINVSVWFGIFSFFFFLYIILSLTYLCKINCQFRVKDWVLQLMVLMRYLLQPIRRCVKYVLQLIKIKMMSLFFLVKNSLLNSSNYYIILHSYIYKY